MGFQWVDIEKTIVRRAGVEGAVQFIQADSVAYQEEVLPWVSAGNEIAPAYIPPVIGGAKWVEFRAALVFAPEVGRILDSIAEISSTKHSSIMLAWSKVEDRQTLDLAVQFWNMGVVPTAGIQESEVSAIAALAEKFNIPILVAADGMIEVANVHF